ncbi:MAG: hypothetical protein IPP94_04725 [Ignavibacteria bacterium]|nr:hypothetical protein [Ignavibacteria bacterium]
MTSGSIESGAGTRDITVRWDSSGTGSVSARVSRSVAGCVATATINVLVGSRFSFPIRRPARLTACEGDSLLLEAPSGLLGIRWSNGATTPGIVARASGIYFVTAFDSIGCPGFSDTVAVRFEAAPRPAVLGPRRLCAGATAAYTIVPRSGASSAWTVRNGSPVTGPGNDSIVVRWDVPGRGVVRVRQSLDSLGCAGEDSIAVDVTAPPKPAIALSGGTTICEGDSLVLNAPPYPRHAWSTGDTTRAITVRASGAYFVAVTDSSGCSGVSDTIRVSVAVRPVVRIAALGATAFCDGDSVLLDGGDFRGYRWNTGDTTRAIVVKRGGVYTLQARGAGPCDGYSDTVAVTVFPRPVASIARVADTLTASPPGMRYRWSRDGVFGAADTARALIATVDGRYQVEVTSPDGCPALSPPYDMTRVDLTVTASLQCPSRSTVAPGERLSIGLRLQLPAAFQTSGISGAELFLHARGNVFAPAPAPGLLVTQTGSMQKLRVTRDLAGVTGSDVDIPVELLAMLGDTGCARIVLDSVRWQEGSVPVQFANVSCDICVSLCVEGGARLFSGDVRATLAQNHPNPFNATTTLTYTLIERGYTRLAVLDRLGREVAVLDEGMRDPGVHRAVFDASALPSGVYTALLLTPTLALQRTMVLMK